ncbi:MAG: ABC-F family ATP-binding cassette domain-containing protein [Bacteroidia bacterium]|nr:ABC-F family ATP-binding cassette domain-containing protein [Bacteroidia bacterium]
MLNIDNLGIEFAGKWLLRNASYQFFPGDRIGLIGRNGAGKSTLLKVLAGQMSQSEGHIHQAGKIRIAYFHQDLLSYHTDRPIADVAREGFGPLLKLKEEIDDLLLRMEAGETRQEVWDKLAENQAQFDAQGGSQIDAQVHSILSGLGFRPEEHEQPYYTFSGGWRMRVLLAQMLLNSPDILLLDEPTNHLDLPSIQWLESYLKTFPGTCIVVSHDRFFIDRVANKIVEIYLKQLHTYTGNYTYFLAEKALRKEQHRRAYDNQQKFIEDQELFINRFRYKSSKATQVQSRVKQLEKLERVLPPEDETGSMNFRFKMKVNSGKEVLALSDIHKAYEGKTVIDHTAATVMRGDKIAFIGANGIGKSTFLRIMAGTEPFEGTCKIGHNVTYSFFAQHQLEALNLKNTVFQEVAACATDKTEAELRSLLGCFMFSGDDILKKIQVLSGGEKSRVALAKTLLSEANFLLLDEPTNHLDMGSIQVLVQALNAFEGTFVVVSHDRFFLQQIANKIWYVEDRQIKEYPGTYEEYDWWREKQNLPAEDSAKTVRTKPTESPVVVETPDFRNQKQNKNKLRKLSRDQENIEAEITRLEAEILALEEKMILPEIARDFNRLFQEQEHHSRLQKQLETATATWEAILLELEALAGE